jgi:hypothetical protein
VEGILKAGVERLRKVRECSVLRMVKRVLSVCVSEWLLRMKRSRFGRRTTLPLYLIFDHFGRESYFHGRR